MPIFSDHHVDYVFLDCPPSLGLLTLNALVAANEILVPIQCEYYALEGVTQLMRTIDLVKGELNSDLRLSTVMLTMFDGRTKLAAQVADEVRNHFPAETLPTVIPRSVRISEAPSYGQTVLTYQPSSAGAISYLEAAHEIAQRGSRGERMNIGTERRGLGRGLGELFQRTEPRPARRSSQSITWRQRRSHQCPQGSYFADLPLGLHLAQSSATRTVFDEEAMNELVESIREVGMLQPIVVRPLGGAKFELVMGERRWRAAQQAGSGHDPCDRSRDCRPRPAPRRTAGEPAPRSAQPAGRGRGLSADARGLRLHPGGAG